MGEQVVGQGADNVGATPVPDQAPASLPPSGPSADSGVAAGAGAPNAPPAAASQTPEQIAQSALAAGQQTAPVQPTQAAAPQATASTPALPADVQARLDRFEQLERHLPQLQQYAQFGYQQWLAQQQAAQAQQAQAQQAEAAKPWFQLPEFDLALAEFVEKDPATGQLRAREGAPLDVVPKYQAFQKALAETQLGFFQNPAKYLSDPIKRIATEIAQQTVRQHFGGYEQRVTADKILAENRGWMVTSGADGQAQLTPAGQLYQQYAEYGSSRLNINDPTALHAYARERVELDLLRAERSQRQAGTQGDAAKQQFLANAAPPGGPATPPSPRVVEPAPVPGGPQDLRTMLTAAFKANGINDATFRAV